MKKSTAVMGVVVLLGAAYLGTSWYTGQQAEIKIREGVLKANEQVATLLDGTGQASGMGIVIQEYERGLFSSTAVYTLNTKNADGEPIELKFTDHLQHGPFPASLVKTGNFAPMLAYSQAHLLATPPVQAWFDSQKGATPLSAETRIGFGGEGHSVWTFAPVTYDQEDARLNFSGGAVNIDFSNNFQDSVSTAQFSAFSVLDKESDETLNLDNIQVNSTSTNTDQRAHLASTVTIDALTMTGDEEIRAEKLTFNLDTVQQDRLLDGSIRYEFERLVASKAELGGLDFTINLARLDLKALSELVTLYDGIRIEQGLEQDETPELNTEQQALLQEKVLTLLQAKPMLSLDPLVWENSAGRTTGRLVVDLAAPADADAALHDPLSALTEILSKVQLELSVPRAMFVQAFAQLQGPDATADEQAMGGALYDQYVASAQEAGLIKSTADGAALTLVYEDEEVVLNDMKMSLQNFVMLIMVLGM